MLDELDKLRQNKFFWKFMKLIETQAPKSTKFLGISATLGKDDVNLFSQFKKKFKIVSNQKLAFLTTSKTNSPTPAPGEARPETLLTKRPHSSPLEPVVTPKADLNLKNLLQFYVEVPSLSSACPESTDTAEMTVLEKYSESQKAPSSRLFKRHMLEHLLKTIVFQKAIIFVSDRNADSDLREHLSDSLGEKVLRISGSMSQKQRLFSLNQFKHKDSARVLITTDLLSRGIDVKIVDVVVNFDLPRDVQTYFHRVGRCGRFGNFGCSFIFLDHKSLQFLRNHELFFVKFERIGLGLSFADQKESLAFVNGIGEELAKRDFSRKSVLSRILGKKRPVRVSGIAKEYLDSFRPKLLKINDSIANHSRTELRDNLVGISHSSRFDLMQKWADADAQFFDPDRFNYVKESELDAVSVSSLSLNQEEKELIGDS